MPYKSLERPKNYPSLARSHTTRILSLQWPPFFNSHKKRRTQKVQPHFFLTHEAQKWRCRRLSSGLGSENCEPNDPLDPKFCEKSSLPERKAAWLNAGYSAIHVLITQILHQKDDFRRGKIAQNLRYYDQPNKRLNTTQGRRKSQQVNDSLRFMEFSLAARTRRGKGNTLRHSCTVGTWLRNPHDP